jgi:hypothetical protein
MHSMVEYSGYECAGIEPGDMLSVLDITEDRDGDTWLLCFKGDPIKGLEAIAWIQKEALKGAF